MENIEKLKTIGILETLREQIGANDENDDTYDEYINELDNSQLIEKFCKWHLGDGGWWIAFKELFDKLEALDKNNQTI